MILDSLANVSALSDVSAVLTSESAQPHWWQIATGILAIPAAIIGLVYSYALVKKTRLEAVKIELEIREKQSQISNLTSEAHSAGFAELTRAVLDPVLQGRFVQTILLHLFCSTWCLRFGR